LAPIGLDDAPFDRHANEKGVGGSEAVRSPKISRKRANPTALGFASLRSGQDAFGQFGPGAKPALGVRLSNLTRGRKTLPISAPPLLLCPAARSHCASKRLSLNTSDMNVSLRFALLEPGAGGG
jgi:hypothetical protein